MGQQLGSRVFIGVALAVVAALGVTQPGASAESPATTAGSQAGPDVEQYPTVCPKPTAQGADALPTDPCEPYDPCAEDADGDGIGDCEDPCPTDPSNTCNEPTTPPTTEPTTAPPTTAPPTTAPPTTQPPVAPTTTPTTSPPTTVPQPTPAPGCTSSCAYVRQVELTVTAKKLRGAISSQAAGCRAATVTVWRQKSGADRRLVVLTSKATGTFRTGRPARAGRYYVTVTSPEQPLCASARSSAVRVERS